MTFIMTYKFGEILICKFPFSSNTGNKKRPVVVINSLNYKNSWGDVILLAITSQIDNDDTLLIKDWQEAGLYKPSAFKGQIFTLLKEDILTNLGDLSAKDRLLLKQYLKKIIDIE